MSIKITEIEHCDQALLDAFARLTPQLSQNAPIPTTERLERIISSSTSHLLAAVTDEGVIAGVLTLVFYDIPTYCKAWIEDVITDSDYRGQGIGRSMLTELRLLAKFFRCQEVILSVYPENDGAIAFYQKCGFFIRSINMDMKV